MSNNIRQPKFRFYVTTKSNVKVDEMESFMKKKHQIQDAQVIQGASVNAVTFTANASKVSEIYRYLQKKSGIKNVRIGV